MESESKVKKNGWGVMGREVGGGSGWGTYVPLWQIHVNVWQNQYNIVKKKKDVLKRVRLISLIQIQNEHM